MSCMGFFTIIIIIILVQMDFKTLYGSSLSKPIMKQLRLLIRQNNDSVLV